MQITFKITNMAAPVFGEAKSKHITLSVCGNGFRCIIVMAVVCWLYLRQNLYCIVWEQGSQPEHHSLVVTEAVRPPIGEYILYIKS